MTEGEQVIQPPRSSTMATRSPEGQQDNQPPRPSTMTPTTTPRPRLTVDDREKIRLKALQKQTEVQDTLCQGVLKMGKTLEDIARYSRKLYEQKKQELTLLKEKEERKKAENIEKKRQHKDKMETKLKELELKTLKYNIRK
ncbi:MICOS complex subunit mic25a-like [Eurosta solidaginis]